MITESDYGRMYRAAVGAAANLGSLREECYGDRQGQPKTHHADNHLNWEM